MTDLTTKSTKVKINPEDIVDPRWAALKKSVGDVSEGRISSWRTRDTRSLK